VSAPCVAWRDGVARTLRNLASALEAADELTVDRLYRTARIGEAAATARPGFPAIGQEPFNIGPDELTRSWDEGKV
jgi:hypothetical protein